MKIFAIVLMVGGLMSIIVGTAIMSAVGSPPEFANWTWMIGPVELHANRAAVWAYTPDEQGTWDTALIFWPPRIHRSYISHAYANLLMDDRAWSYEPSFDPAVHAELDRLRAESMRRDWTWPDYWRR
jgi:hypothetical protein